ncbi:formate--tetrahydrofolate ligase [Peptoniphilus sp. GNH]|nr:formate--tetrahydrofolate ligase [Peptoniphilus sp. GNH]
MKTDIQIAKETTLKPIDDLAKDLGLAKDAIELYGPYKAKIDYKKITGDRKGKLVLVTAMSPTPAGEGKTTVSIGLSEGLNKLGIKSMLALREPSLGPVFGIKGGAAGGGYSQVLPMEDINLHFTGDLHAITSANNLLAALLDNHMHQGFEPEIDPRKINFKRVLNMNDRSLRNIVLGLGGELASIPREEHFMITAASEIMAIVCLAENLEDLKERIGRIIVAYTRDDKPVYASDIGAADAVTILLKDAIKPNLVQTCENTPAIIHGGPFANIAHGCNSVIATKTALSLSDVVITEAGFGADLGAEKFFDIKCGCSGLSPDAVVLVVTIRALKYHGGLKDLSLVDLQAIRRGFSNVGRHCQNLKKYGLPLIVAINHFYKDTDEEIDLVKELLKEEGIKAQISKGFELGGQGAEDLAKLLLETLKEGKNFKPLYSYEDSIKSKIEKIAKEIYRASHVSYSTVANKKIAQLEKNDLDKLPICIAKTQYSFSDNKDLLGAPEDFEFTISDINISNGAGFIVALSGDMMVMPGLNKNPAAKNMKIDANGNIEGLF